MCNCGKSGVYVASNSDVAVADGSIIPIGEVQRCYGNDVVLDGDTVIVCGKNRAFNVTAVFMLTAAAAGEVVVELRQDGVGVIGALSKATVAGASDQAMLVVQGVVKNICKCSSKLAFVLTGTGITVDDSSVVVESWGC